MKLKLMEDKAIMLAMLQSIIVVIINLIVLLVLKFKLIEFPSEPHWPLLITVSLIIWLICIYDFKYYKFWYKGVNLHIQDGSLFINDVLTIDSLVGDFSFQLQKGLTPFHRSFVVVQNGSSRYFLFPITNKAYNQVEEQLRTKI